MDLRSWTWGQVALTIIGYWGLVIAGWWFYTTRPSRQARARAAATIETFPGSERSEKIVVLSGTTNLTGLLVALAGPPLLFVFVRWAL
jgi:hypothetical protein